MHFKLIGQIWNNGYQPMKKVVSVIVICGPIRSEFDLDVYWLYGLQYSC